MTCTTFYFDPDSRAVHAYANQKTGKGPMIPISCENTKHALAVMATKAIHLALSRHNDSDSIANTSPAAKKRDLSIAEIVDGTISGPRFSMLTNKQQEAIDDFKWKLANGVKLTASSIAYAGVLFDRANARGNFA